MYFFKGNNGFELELIGPYCILHRFVMLHMYWHCCHIFLRFFLFSTEFVYCKSVVCDLEICPSYLCLQLLAYKQHFIHMYRHAYLMYLHTRFNIPTSSGWFVITIKQKAKKIVHICIPSSYFKFHVNITCNKICMFSNICYPTL